VLASGGQVALEPTPAPVLRAPHAPLVSTAPGALALAQANARSATTAGVDRIPVSALSRSCALCTVKR
jgi:hypothetical protein